MNAVEIVAGTDTPQSPQHGRRAALVHDILQREILTLDLAPGSALDETQLAKRFSMSRSPVREALSRLAAQNLVVMLPNRSTMVAPLELSDFPPYIEALDVAQRVCTRLAAERRSDADLAAMRAAADAFDASLAPHDHLDMLAANKEFHMVIAAAAQNRYLASQYEVLLDEGRRLMRLYFLHLDRERKPNPLADDHHLMVQAIADKNPDEAERLAGRHTRLFRSRLLEFLGRVGTAEFNVVPDVTVPCPRNAAQDAGETIQQEDNK